MVIRLTVSVSSKVTEVGGADWLMAAACDVTGVMLSAVRDIEPGTKAYSH
jgi:hypothetical protein